MDQRFLGAEMRGTPSPCGACRFLKRKCVRGCVFAPYFCHEEGTAHFAAIHHIFGAGRISKLLSSLPIGDRCQAAVTISFEAQARIQDPVYGCVSQILSLQQQVFSLQAQLASFKEQAAQTSELNPSGSSMPSLSTDAADSMENAWLPYEDNAWNGSYEGAWNGSSHGQWSFEGASSMALVDAG
ncbi:hypothetical protein SAY86_000128 [Trapa natans]|uniref:LOB domain-containing protein n=1 Tax=Trapa natans TaxID=22666 RepID=A0AAN7MTW7_TRANT|nr:hypothetical protein SAY86_000128 [Trapa natans]